MHPQLLHFNVFCSLFTILHFNIYFIIKLEKKTSLSYNPILFPLQKIKPFCFKIEEHFFLKRMKLSLQIFQIHFFAQKLKKFFQQKLLNFLWLYARHSILYIPRRWVNPIIIFSCLSQRRWNTEKTFLNMQSDLGLML